MITTLLKMILGYGIKPYFSNHNIFGCPSLCSTTTSLRMYTGTKRLRKLGKVE